MHTILTDFGRSYKEITDVEWDIRTVSARSEQHWTYASAWGDHLASTHRMTRDRMGDELRMTQSSLTEATRLRCEISNGMVMNLMTAGSGMARDLRACRSRLT